MNIPSESCQLLTGKPIAEIVKLEIKATIDRWRAKAGRAPGLAVILVGDNPASLSYVASKERFAHECGVETFNTRLSATVSQVELESCIQQYNLDPRVDGILLQLPLPKHLHANRALRLISYKKDADGLHPYNQGILISGESGPRSCTPLGIMKLLDTVFGAGSISGKHAVVIGRSTLVGKPIALMLLERDATVTICHSKTSDLANICRSADILVAAVGQPGLVRGDWIKPGAVVIDVGTSRLDSGKLAGDVVFDEAVTRARALTPVPGGVGPLTVAMLIHNTVANYLSGAAHD